MVFVTGAGQGRRTAAAPGRQAADLPRESETRVTACGAAWGTGVPCRIEKPGQRRQPTIRG